MTSSGEEDYMSESFLMKCIPAKNDPKPGLIFNRTAKRQHEFHKKKKEIEEKKRKCNLKSSEDERRDMGLNNPISAENKGFSLLQKMGYKPETGIGKTGTGSKEPIQIKLKNDRFGLGRETVLKEIAELKSKKKALKNTIHNDVCNVENFRKRFAERAKEKSTAFDLQKSQKICQQLDKDKGIDSPPELWFWPETETVDEDEEENSSEDLINFEPCEQLQILTDYLRNCHLYCIWCATSFEDDDDLQSNCPGKSRDDH